MPDNPTILVIGTADTKAEELLFIVERIEAAGAAAHIMDVGILGTPPFEAQSSRQVVAKAAGTSIEDIISLNDKSQAIATMAEGAAKLARKSCDDGRFQAVLALGGVAGTDIALEVCHALPLGVPKCLASSIAFSPLIPAERLAADIQMILWAGGLQGLNGMSKSVLRQAAGAVVGAACAVEQPTSERPLIGITSLGKSRLNYMTHLKPALEKRGYDVAVFHSNGMGGRAFEALASEGAFAAVMDFCLQELSNELNDSVASAGADRLENCGRVGIPQIVAPGAINLIDLAASTPLPAGYKEREIQAESRLITSVAVTSEERRQTARTIFEKLKAAKAPTHILLPIEGIEERDRAGEALYDPLGHAAFVEELQQVVEPPVGLTLLDCHINDRVFATEALKLFDRWVEEGIIVTGQESPAA